jgi:hypothetical protein
MKKLLHIFIFIASSFFCFSQGNENQFNIPKILPPSPNVAGIEKFGSIPVSLSNGTTSISIPIWNISCGGLSWPITLAYNTGGIKVSEISSNVGTGWALTGPGVITRTVIGRPDEENVAEPNFETVSWSDYQFLYSVIDGTGDSEYDCYSYNFNGKTGKFFIKQNGQIFAVPYTNMKITYNSSGFIITDESGYIYTFDKIETTTPYYQSSYNSSWYLTKVQTPDKKQSIDFKYTNAGYVRQTSTTFTHRVLDFSTNNFECGFGPYSTMYPDSTRSIIDNNVCKLDSIIFPNGSINFNYVNDRTDFLEAATAKHRLAQIDIKQSGTNQILKTFSLTQSYFSPGHRLKLDNVAESRNINSALKKNYSFEYNSTSMVPTSSYAQDKWGFNNGKTTNPTLFQRDTVMDNSQTTMYYIGNADRSTDTIAAKAGTLTAITWPTGGRTEFTYDMHQFYPGGNESSTAQVVAHAIGPNSVVTNTFTYPIDMVAQPMVSIDISRYDYPNATPGSPYVQIKDLTTNTVVYEWLNLNSSTPMHIEQGITLANGHNYEIKGVKFSSNANPAFFSKIILRWTVLSSTPIIEKGGGLRIRTVKNFTKTGVLAGTDYYEYETGVPVSQYYFLNLNKKGMRFLACCHKEGGETVTNVGPFSDLYYAQPIYPITTVAGVPIMYKKVTKYQLDESGVDKGKAVYEYNVFRDEIQNESLNYFFIYFTNNQWKNGTLLKESHFKKTGAGVYELIKTIENEYNEIKIESMSNLQVKTLVSNLPGCENLTKTIETAPFHMMFYYVPIWSGINKLTKTKETEYDGNGNSKVTNLYSEFSAASHDFLTKSKKTDSKGVMDVTTYKYPVDFSATGNVYSKMVAKNMINPVIETKEFTNDESTLLSTIKNAYRDWKNDSLVLDLEFIQSSLGADPLTNKIAFTNYNDRKQPLEVKKDQDATMCYIYGYNYQYPIAEVKNAIQADVAYTGFEAGDKGGWTFSGSTITDVSAPMGRGCYDLSSPITKTGMNTAYSYIVSYWKKTGTVTISGTTPVAGRTVNGWTYYEHKINSPAPSSILIVGSSAIIDELRLYPASGVLMNTYTYDALIGLTSQCDVNNRITYYEYDGFQRLALIRDQEKKILKKFSYNYNGQIASDNIYYNAIASGSFQKAGACSGCNVGSYVTYTVPSGIYSSTVSQVEADAMASAEVAANGQAYANANGSCVTPPIAIVLSTISISKPVQYTFYNTCTATTIVYNRSGNEVDWSLPNIPQGTYNITFNVSPTGNHKFQVITSLGTYTQTSSSQPITISGVTFGASGTSVKVTPP